MIANTYARKAFTGAHNDSKLGMDTQSGNAILSAINIFFMQSNNIIRN